MTYPYVPATTGPVDNVAFALLLQAAIKEITGLPGNMVRPAFQIDPPILPPPSADWCALNVGGLTPDNDAYITTQGLGGTLERQESGDVLVSFYGPSAMGNCGLLRDGLAIPFNREVLRSQGIAIQREGETLRVPELIADRWYDRADFTLGIVREVRRTYRILSFISASGVIHGHGPDPTIDVPFSVHQ